MADNKQETFAQRLQKAAKYAGIPYEQTKLGNHVGLDRRTMDRWMNAGGTPDPERLFQIAHHLGVRARWLWDGEGSMIEAPPKPSDAAVDLYARYMAADDGMKGIVETALQLNSPPVGVAPKRQAKKR